VVLDGGIVPYSGALFCSSEVAGYAKDASRVWYADFNSPKIVEGADVSTFTSLGNRFGRDCANVYFEQKRIGGADISSWRHWKGYLSLDEKNVFVFNKRIKGIDRSSVVLLEARGYMVDRYRIFLGLKQSTKEEYLKSLENLEQRCQFERKMLESGKLFDRILDEWPHTS
jgi:hypothetical protein